MFHVCNSPPHRTTNTMDVLGDFPEDFFSGPSIMEMMMKPPAFKPVDLLLEKLQEQYFPFHVEPVLALMMADQCPFCKTSEHLKGKICCPPMYDQLSIYSRLSHDEQISGESSKYDTVCRMCRGKHLVDKAGHVCYDCYKTEMLTLTEEEHDYCVKRDIEWGDSNINRYLEDMKTRSSSPHSVRTDPGK